MKLIILLLIVGSMQVSATGYSQTVTFSGKNVPLATLFASIEKQTGLSFFFNYALLKNTKPVTVEVKDAALEVVLHSVLKEQGLDFYIKGKTVFIVPAHPAAVTPPVVGEPGDVSLVTVTGKVTNQKGEVLAGASVSVKNGKQGTLTNEKGIFELRRVSPTAVLEISFTGFTTTEVHVNGEKGVLAVQMALATSSLDAPQVIAYGTTSDRLSTGDVSVVKAADIEIQPVTNVLEAIEGRVPGLFITQSSGMPGASYQVQLRGMNSIHNGNDPLYVVDGIPYPSEMLANTGPGGGVFGGNPLDFINPLDIESISVLKDADATAIYGSRAANGAILITTKKGTTTGKTRLDVNVQEGASKVPERVQWMNTPEYLEIRHEAFNNDSVAPNIYNAPDLLYWDTTRYTNWQKAMIGQTAHYQDAQIDLSGGNASIQYVLGGNYHRETTAFPLVGSNQNGAVHVSISNSSVDQKFKMTATGNYMVNNRNLPAADLTSFINTAPDAPPVRNADGTLDWDQEHWIYGNPIASTYNQYKGQTNNLVSNVLLSYLLVQGLTIKASVGYSNMQVNETSTNPIAAQDPAYLPLGSANFTNNNIHGWIAEPQANYSVKFGPHKLDLLAGSTFEENISQGQILNGYNYTSDELLTNLQAAPNWQVNSYTYNQYKYNAVFGKLNYNISDEYLVNLSARRDGSSRFGSANQWHDFGSVGLAWIFSREKLMQEYFSFLSFGKLRASYGTTGNDQIGNYQYYDLFQPSANTYGGTSALTPVGLSNPYLAWEETKKLEGAIDLGFMKDRIILKANYYYNRSSNELLSSPLPLITGFASVLVNLPATVQNTGWEFVLTTTNVKTKNIRWTSSINLTMTRNKVVAFPNLSNSPYSGIITIGKPIGTNPLYHLLGVDPQTGLYQFQDFHGNPTFSPSYTTDRTSFVNFFPKYYGGFQNSIGIKTWQLDVFLQFRNITGINPILQQSIPGLGNNLPTPFLHHWQKPGDKTAIEKMTETFGSAVTALQYAEQSDGNYTNASFIRLSNLSLSYQLNSIWSKRAHLQSCKIYVHGQNLLVISKYKGVDPETQSFAALPPLRVITGGILLSL